MKVISIYSSLLFSLVTIPTQARLGRFTHSKLLDYNEKNEKQIQDELIVVFHSEMMNQSISLLENVQPIVDEHGGDIIKSFDNVFKGIMIRGMPEERIKMFLDHDSVHYASMNQLVTTSSTQSNAVWNLDRIDQSSLPLDGVYGYTNDGTGVTAYIVDTGIHLSHSEFTGRASCGFSAFPNEGSQPCDDLVGHGTHVAGTIGGITYGVAKNVNLVSVKVLSNNGEGSMSEVISGLDWVAKQKQQQPKTPSVINMSLGGGLSTPLTDAINTLVNAGVTVVVAAGNNADDACSYSPSSATRAITVGAFNETDQVAGFSNQGSCVDIYAPGTNVLSASPADDSATMTLSGTSMATPAVVGVVALYLEKNPSLTPDQVWSAMQTDSSKDKVTGLKASTSSSLNPSTPNPSAQGLEGFFSRFFSSFKPVEQHNQNLMLYKTGTL